MFIDDRTNTGRLPVARDTAPENGETRIGGSCDPVAPPASPFPEVTLDAVAPPVSPQASLIAGWAFRQQLIARQWAQAGVQNTIACASADMVNVADQSLQGMVDQPVHHHHHGGDMGYMSPAMPYPGCGPMPFGMYDGWYYRR